MSTEANLQTDDLALQAALGSLLLPLLRVGRVVRNLVNLCLHVLRMRLRGITGLAGKVVLDVRVTGLRTKMRQPSSENEKSPHLILDLPILLRRLLHIPLRLVHRLAVDEVVVGRRVVDLRHALLAGRDGARSLHSAAGEEVAADEGEVGHELADFGVGEDEVEERAEVLDRY